MSQRRFEADLRDGHRDHNLRFKSMVTFLRRRGSSIRVRGDHHIFSHAELPEIINIQPRAGKCKSYQVKQIRRILIRHGRL